jgi:hypothetical protein
MTVVRTSEVGATLVLRKLILSKAAFEVFELQDGDRVKCIFNLPFDGYN